MTFDLRPIVTPCAAENLPCAHTITGPYQQSIPHQCGRSANYRVHGEPLCWQHAQPVIGDLELVAAQTRQNEAKRYLAETKPKRRPRPAVGLVYAIQAQWVGRRSDEGPVKIGYSSDEQTLDLRLKALQTSHWLELKIIWRCPGTMALEREIHKRLDRWHIRGEWFHFVTPAVPQLLLEITEREHGVSIDELLAEGGAA